MKISLAKPAHNSRPVILKLGQNLRVLNGWPPAELEVMPPTQPSATSDRAGCNGSEVEFMRLLEERYPGALSWRSGWPDFLVRLDGERFIAIEVKSASDDVRPAQRAMFTALEAGGIDVFIWCPDRPWGLRRWRAYRPEPKVPTKWKAAR